MKKLKEPENIGKYAYIKKRALAIQSKVLKAEAIKKD